MSFDIVKNVSQINNGFQLSPNFMLEHMTTGAFNKILGKWTPQFPQQLIPWLPNGIFSQGFPLLPLVQNLQGTANNLMEQMISTVGSQLNVMAGFIASNKPTSVSADNPFGLLTGDEGTKPNNSLVDETGHTVDTIEPQQFFGMYVYLTFTSFSYRRWSISVT